MNQQPNTPAAALREQELKANIARALGISKHTKGMDMVMKLVQLHTAAECRAARLDELRKVDPVAPHLLAATVGDRIATLTKEKTDA